MAEKYIILGSTGLLGQALMRELKSRNIDAIGLARKNADVNLDASNWELLKAAIKNYNPDKIINTIAIINHQTCKENPVQANKVNAEISKKMTHYCAKEEKKYIFVSTDHYYCGDKNKKHSETEQLILRNEYAISKQLGEKYTLENNDALVVRTNIVGFRNNPNQPTFVEWVIDTLIKQSPVTLFYDYFTSSIDVTNFSKALIDLIDKNACGIFNLASSDVFSKEQFIRTLAERIGLSLENAKSGSLFSFGSSIDRNESLGLDVSKAEAVLGYSLPGLGDVIESLATEYLRNRS